MPTIYFVSGPAGVGKSTTSAVLVNALRNSAYISGDDVSHMHINGREKEWESAAESALIWANLLSLTRNFVTYGADVVIDYVTFPKEAYWLMERLGDLNVDIVYTVLWTDKDTLLERDRLRIPDHQMRERCLILMEEFMQSGLDKKHLLDISRTKEEAMDQTVAAILTNKTFRLNVLDN